MSCSCSCAGTAAGNTTRPGCRLNTSAVTLLLHVTPQPLQLKVVLAPEQGGLGWQAHAVKFAGCCRLHMEMSSVLVAFLTSMTSERSVGCSTSFPPRNRPFLQDGDRKHSWHSLLCELCLHLLWLLCRQVSSHR